MSSWAGPQEIEGVWPFLGHTMFPSPQGLGGSTTPSGLSFILHSICSYLQTGLVLMYPSDLRSSSISSEKPSLFLQLKFLFCVGLWNNFSLLYSILNFQYLWSKTMSGFCSLWCPKHLSVVLACSRCSINIFEWMNDHEGGHRSNIPSAKK